MIYMVIPGIYSEHAWRLYILDCGSHLGTHTICNHYYKKIMISTYSYNKIYDEHTMAMLLPLDAINKFLVSRFIDVKRVQYKIHDIFGCIIAKIQ
jgi:hypothetical protein